MNILVVDDDKVYLNIVESALKNAFSGVNIIVTTSGKDALDFCLNDKVDLLLLDLHIPDMNGTTIAKLLQHTQRTKDIPIIFVTTSSYSDFEKEGFMAGSVDYISKPIEKNLLINRVSLYMTIIEQNKLLQNANHKLKKKVHKVKDKNKMQQQMLIHQSKTSVMGEMIGAIAHQWRQPLNIIAAAMINMETKAELNILDNEEIKRINTKVNKTLQFLSKTIDNFRNFFLSSKEREYLNLVNIIKSTIELVEAQFTAHNIAIDFQYKQDEDYTVHGYYNELRQVFLNLFANSKDALEIRMKNTKNIDGLITIKLDIDKNNIKVLICDNGGGIPKNIIKKIFAPYFTTKFAGQGTGTGLYLSKTIIEKLHSGSIDVYTHGDNTCFDILILQSSTVSS